MPKYNDFELDIQTSQINTNMDQLNAEKTHTCKDETCTCWGTYACPGSKNRVCVEP